MEVLQIWALLNDSVKSYLQPTSSSPPILVYPMTEDLPEYLLFVIPKIVHLFEVFGFQTSFFQPSKCPFTWPIYIYGLSKKVPIDLPIPPSIKITPWLHFLYFYFHTQSFMSFMATSTLLAFSFLFLIYFQLLFICNILTFVIYYFALALTLFFLSLFICLLHQTPLLVLFCLLLCLLKPCQ